MNTYMNMVDAKLNAREPLMCVYSKVYNKSWVGVM